MEKVSALPESSLLLDLEPQPTRAGSDPPLDDSGTWVFDPNSLSSSSSSSYSSTSTSSSRESLEEPHSNGHPNDSLSRKPPSFTVTKSSQKFQDKVLIKTQQQAIQALDQAFQRIGRTSPDDIESSRGRSDEIRGRRAVSLYDHRDRLRPQPPPERRPFTSNFNLSYRRQSIVHRKPKSGLPLSGYKKWTLLCLSLVNFTSFLTMSIIAPFFPFEASQKGMSETLSGFVFSVYALVMMIASPLLGKALPHVGGKFMLITGIWFAGWSNILFGVLDQAGDGTPFIVLCFVVRSFGALGASAFSTASYTYIIHLFPDHVGLAFGLTETCVGLGMSLGPAVGGLLYGLGGYGLPFYILGSFVLINIPVCWYLVKPLKIEPQETTSASPSYTKLLSIPKVIVFCFVLMTATATQGFLDPTVEPQFRQYGIKPEFVGLIFLTMSAAYAISSPIAGWFAGRTKNKAPLMIIGLLATGVGYLLLGPSAFLGLAPTFWLSTLAMFILGLAYSLAFIPTFESILEAVIDNGLPDDVTTYSLVSGLWSCFNSLGEVVGASLGGLFMDLYGFSQGADTIALWVFIAALILLMCYVTDVCCKTVADSDCLPDLKERQSIEENLKKPIKKQSKQPSNSEKSLLINKSNDSNSWQDSFLSINLTVNFPTGCDHFPMTRAVNP